MFVLKDNISIGYCLSQLVLIDLLDELKMKYLNIKSSFMLYSLLNFKDEESSIGFIQEFNMFDDERAIRMSLSDLKEELKDYLVDEDKNIGQRENKIDLKRLLKSKSTKFKNRFRLDYPVKLVWIPTWKCNKNCLYCGVKKIRPTEKEDQIPISIMYERLQEAIDKGVRQISIHGGDPLFYYNENIYELLEFFKKNNIKINISTKNHISLDMAKKLKTSGLEKIQLSIDTIEENLLETLYEDFDYVRKFDDTVRNLKAVEIKSTVNVVLSTINYKGVIRLLEHLTKLEVEQVTISKFKKSDINPVDYSLNIEQQNCVSKEILENKKNFKFEKLRCNILDNQLKSAKEKAICESCKTSLLILPDGRCCYCDFLSSDERFVFGDLKEETINEAWNSDELTRFLNPSQKEFHGTKCFKCDGFKDCVERGLCFVESDKNKKFAPDHRCIECYAVKGDKSWD